MLFVAFLTIFSFANLFAIISAAPFVPSKKKRVDAMIAIADLQKTDVLLDLGSGDGRIVRRVAPLVKESRGIEINSSLVWYARFVNALTRVKNAVIINADFWKYNLDDVDVLFVYCIDHRMTKLEEKVKREMKSGARIVSNGFRFLDWQPESEKDGVRLYRL